MEQILDLINQQCHFYGNPYRCPWKMNHFSGTYVKDYCYNYNMIFKICKPCQEYSKSLMNMISRQSLVLAVLTKQEATIKKLTKKIKKLEGKKSNKVHVPEIVQDYQETPNFLDIDQDEICHDSPRIEYIDPQSDEDEPYIIPEKSHLLPQSVKFKEEIELYKLNDSNS